MALTLTQLLAPITVDQARTMLLGSLQGLGIVVAGGAGAGGVALGTGSLTLSGTPAAAYTKIVIKIVTAGELGAAQFQYSTDGGVTFSGTVTTPVAPGAYVLTTTGATITFVTGPIGAGTSFGLGDTFTFALQVPGLQVTAWGAAGAYRQLVETEAQAAAAFSAQQAAIAAGGLTTQATGSWADLIGVQFYGLTRNAAAVTKGLATLTSAVGAGPYTIAIGQLWISDASGHRYNNTTGGTLNANSALQLSWVAEQAGAAYNAANNAVNLISAGTLPGVTVNNPDPGSGTWVTSQGSDAETDSAYMLRCQQRWPALAAIPNSPTAVFQLWATSAEAAAGHATTITKTLVLADTATPGQVDIYLAGASGAVGGGAVTDAQTYINPRTGITNTVLIQAATNVAITLAGTVNYFSAKTTLSAAQAAVAAALAAYFNALGIGSDAGGANVKLYYNALLGLVETPLNPTVAANLIIRNVTGFLVNGASADIGLTTGQVATLTNSLTFTGV